MECVQNVTPFTNIHIYNSLYVIKMKQVCYQDIKSHNHYHILCFRVKNSTKIIIMGRKKLYFLSKKIRQITNVYGKLHEFDIEISLVYGTNSTKCMVKMLSPKTGPL